MTTVGASATARGGTATMNRWHQRAWVAILACAMALGAPGSAAGSGRSLDRRAGTAVWLCEKVVACTAIP
jgi:hypothetical protein